ncbi:MAG: hypothetical protein ACYCTB_09315 [bacterium]
MVKNNIIKYLRLKGITINDDVSIDEKIFSLSDLSKISSDRNYIRSLLTPLTKKDRSLIINTVDMGQVERYIYSTYFNHYSKLKKNNAENKPTKKLLSSRIKSNVKLYFKNYRFQAGFNKLIKKLKNKAYYDVFGGSQ